MCGEAEFAELIDEMVAEEAPRVFAVVQEYGERADGRIAAWGMAFEDYAEVQTTTQPPPVLSRHHFHFSGVVTAP